jgi:predicted nucleic acid-binding protein
MKLLDTNVFIRAVAAEITDADKRMASAARSLFEAIRRGDEEVTIYETVLDEVFFVLCSPRQYGLSHADAVTLFRPFFVMDGIRIARKRLYAEAIQLFAENPGLDFTDCLLATYAREDEHDLVTFDRRLARAAGVQVLAR